MTDPTEEWRKRRLADAAAKAGGDAALGRLLGYQSGAHIAQMKKGIRPITEKTVEKVEALRGFNHWFASQEFGNDPSAKSEPTLFEPASVVRISDAVHAVADALNTLPPERLEDAVERLKTMGFAPDSQKARAAVIAALSGEFRIKVA